ncbi:hypothetical protein [Saccharospirillum impatiens]|uniref:hypothetical protein n=1 Tax=Saccharospirillum impatiens TaxID=169438 RepID=UPI00041B4B0E|nr:hypothetical protein [Saccharospirillum impatiens]
MRPVSLKVCLSVMMLLCIASLSLVASAETTLRLGTDIMPPYLFESPDQSLQGDAKRTLDCVFDQLPDYRFQTAIAPWPRVVRLAHRGEIDGWFLYVQNSGSDDFAVLSDPLLLESWYWYSLDDVSDVALDDLKDQTVLVMNGTYQAIWLQSQGFTRFFSVATTDSLVRAFLAGRARHLLVSETVFNEAVDRLNGELSAINQRFVGFIPLGLYITDAFFDQHPGFMRGFNQAAVGCRIEQIALTEQNQRALNERVESLSRWLTSDWVREPVLQANARNQLLSPNDINRIDRQWIDEVRTGEYDLIAEVLSRDLSIRLALIRRQSQGVFSELFITDIHGATIGTSDITSDWNQGDERPFDAIVTQRLSVQVDAIAYDESTRQFLSQIALPVRDSTGELIGMLVAGVNVENALKGLK